MTDAAEHEQTSIELRDDALIDQPQHWILPTMWWWGRQGNWRLIAKPYAVATAAMVALAFVLALPLWAGVLLAVGVPMALLGLAERGIRNAAKRRAAKVPAGETSGWS